LNKQHFFLPFRGPWASCPNSCSRKAAGDVHNALHELSYLLHNEVAETSHWKPVYTMGKKHSLPGTAAGPKILKRGTKGGRRIDPSNGSVRYYLLCKKSLQRARPSPIFAKVVFESSWYAIFCLCIYTVHSYVHKYIVRVRKVLCMKNIF
jgi:hypothetical protein